MAGTLGSPLRNPYVILRVPFGASRDVATAAFAKQARGLRRVPGGATRLTELTWALNQIEQLELAPHLNLDVYRIPADDRLLFPAAPGVLNPPPERLERRSPDAESAWKALLAATGREALLALCAEVAATASPSHSSNSPDETGD